VILYAGFNVPPAAGIFVALTGFLILHKVPLKRWARIYKAGGKGDFVLLILGALIFKINLETANAVGDVMKILEQNNIPEMAVIFFVPFLVAVLTGVTSATVAITFPLLAPMIGFGVQAKLPLEVLAITGVICGLFVTPIHLCLALSVGYFETDFVKIIARILPAVLLIAATAWVAALFL